MPLAKTLSLSLAAALILAAHPASSFAAQYEMQDVAISSVDNSSSAQDDDVSLWDLFCDLLW